MVYGEMSMAWKCKTFLNKVFLKVKNTYAPLSKHVRIRPTSDLGPKSQKSVPDIGVTKKV